MELRMASRHGKIRARPKSLKNIHPIISPVDHIIDRPGIFHSSLRGISGKCVKLPYRQGNKGQPDPFLALTLFGGLALLEFYSFGCSPVPYLLLEFPLIAIASLKISLLPLKYACAIFFKKFRQTRNFNFQILFTFREWGTIWLPFTPIIKLYQHPNTNWASFTRVIS